MAMGSKHFIFALLAGLALILAVHAQDQSGFISIACGAPANSSFTEDTTGIKYISDATFIDSGESKSVSADIKATDQQQVWNVRSFPQGNRNCYTINVTASTKYLIRATFMYGNYDGKGNLPQFDLYLGPNKWDTIKFKNSSIEVTKELIHVPSLNYIHVCLVNTSSGTPFISAIELRPLKNTSYMTKSGSLAVIFRWDIAGSNRSYRYPDDGHDRFWEPCNNSSWKTLSTNLTINYQSHKDYQPASIIMSTATTPANDSASLVISWDSENVTECYVYIYFAKVVKLQLNQSRSFNITLNGNYCVCDNPNPRGSRSCKKKKNNFVVPIVASLGGLLILSLMVAAFLLGLRRRKHQDETTVVLGDTESNIQNATLESIQGQFTYSDLLKITNNFERIIGKGGIGIVFRGNIDDRQVAVKILLSPSYVQRLQQFQSEVKLLMRLHHRNLTSLVGYCCEGTNMGLIYEYMAYGDLKAHLSGEKANILNWEERLRIAMDAAQGLEYLHHGCKPPIIHGDVKSTNILLTENLCAKLSDFSLSKIFLNDDGTYDSTSVGTPEYQDPEYYISNKLTEKTDIYSFGVVLLEIITSRHVIERSQERTHLSPWLSSVLAKGDIEGTVDPRLHGNFNIKSAWKAVEIALDCLSPTSTKRPTMTQVVDILNECLSLELARRKEGHKDETI